MAGKRKDAAKVEEIQRSPEELTPEQAEDAQGGVLIGLLLPAVQLPKLSPTISPTQVVNHEEQY